MEKNKYNIGEVVHYMLYGEDYDEAKDGFITGILKTRGKYIYIIEQAEYTNYVDIDETNWLDEEDLFPTKEELIASL